MSNKVILSVILVCSVSLVLGATDLYSPSLPNMARYFGVSEALVQYTITSYLTGTAVIPFLYGILADKKGRRFTFLLGFSIYTLGSLICACAPELWTLIGGRFLQGLGGAAVNVIGFAAVKDLYTKEQGAQVIAYHGMAISMTPALAPVLGGYIEVSFGWRMNFILILVLALIILYFIYDKFQETLEHSQRSSSSSIFSHYSLILKHGDFIALSLIHPLLFGAVFAWITVAPFYLIDTLGLTPDAFGVYTMLAVLGYPTGAFLNSKLIPRIGLEKTLFVGLSVCLLACLCFLGVYLFFPTIPLVIMVTISLFVAGLGLVFATSTSLSMSIFPSAAGATSAVLHMLRMGAAAIGSYAGGVMHDNTLKPILIYLTLSTFLSFAIFGYVKRKEIIT